MARRHSFARLQAPFTTARTNTSKQSENPHQREQMHPFHAILLASLLCLGCPSVAQSQSAQPPAHQAQAHDKTMHITIGQHRFVADLADTAAANELRSLLPFTLHMQDHLHNEKHAHLPRALSRNDSRPGRIQAGDIMLWGGNTLVVFYENFDSSYSYTRLGKIREVKNLKAAVGTGSVDIGFTAK